MKRNDKTKKISAVIIAIVIVAMVVTTVLAPVFM